MPTLAQAVQVKPVERKSVFPSQSRESVGQSIREWLSENGEGLRIKDQELDGHIHLVLANRIEVRLSDELRSKATNFVETLREKHNDIDVFVTRDDGIFFHIKFTSRAA